MLRTLEQERRFQSIASLGAKYKNYSPSEILQLNAMVTSTAMPHFTNNELIYDWNWLVGDVDLQTEKYPLSQEEKTAFHREFMTRGIAAEWEGKWVVFSWAKDVVPIKAEEAAEFLQMPSDWRGYIKVNGASV